MGVVVLLGPSTVERTANGPPSASTIGTSSTASVVVYVNVSVPTEPAAGAYEPTRSGSPRRLSDATRGRGCPVARAAGDRPTGVGAQFHALGM